jgi:hypothetical protein
MPTDIPWLNKIVEEAGIPAAADLEGATMIHNEVTGDNLVPSTYRRKPVPYTILGRARRYNVRDVVAYAKRCVEDAPIRTPPQRPRKFVLTAPKPEA